MLLATELKLVNNSEEIGKHYGKWNTEIEDNCYLYYVIIGILLISWAGQDGIGGKVTEKSLIE